MMATERIRELAHAYLCGGYWCDEWQEAEEDAREDSLEFCRLHLSEVRPPEQTRAVAG